MRILIIEDDGQTGGFIAKGLTEAGHRPELMQTGPDGLARALAEEHDAVVLDRMLPNLDGLAIVRTLRAAHCRTPILLLSALGQLEHRVEGLKAGADDYLVKPFAFSELLARLEAISRRHEPADLAATTLTVADLEIDLAARTVSRAGVKLDLQDRAFRILQYLMRNAGRTVTRTMLLEAVWDYHFDPQTNVIDVHISRLRRQVDHGHAVALIKTVRGVGYRLSAEP